MIDWISIVRTSRRRFSTLHVRSPVRIRSRPRKQKSSSSSSSAVQLPTTSSSCQLYEEGSGGGGIGGGASSVVKSSQCNVCTSNRRKFVNRNKWKEDPTNTYCTSPHCPFVSKENMADRANDYTLTNSYIPIKYLRVFKYNSKLIFI